jgi:hypothetical protein
MTAFPPREAYERFIYSLADSYSEVTSSSVRLYPNSPTTCLTRGSVWFKNGLELRVFEYVDLSDGELLDYSYSVFQGEERIRWYDAQPHPEIPELASSFPHHYHEAPDIKHNRRPAPSVSFTKTNLPNIIAEIAYLDPPFASPTPSDDSNPGHAG